MVDRDTPRLTHQSLKVLQSFMENPTDALSGADIRRRTQLLSGTLYPILLRFEDAGILSSVWEEADPHQLGRPRRRQYRITGKGIRVANEAFKSLGITPGKWAWA
jgi:DNA-binding PadR family transcriptional regulator